VIKYVHKDGDPQKCGTMENFGKASEKSGVFLRLLT